MQLSSGVLLDIREQQGLLDGHSFPPPHSDDWPSCWAKIDDADRKAKVAAASIRPIIITIMVSVSGRRNARTQWKMWGR